MKFARRMTQKRWVQKTIGVAAAEHLRLVWMTSRFTMEPADPYRLYGREQPFILAMWHGQHFKNRRKARRRVRLPGHRPSPQHGCAPRAAGRFTA